MGGRVEPNAEVAALIARSNALGSDPRVTNFGGGNTSCKTIAPDPLTGVETEVMWIKGSGLDLGSLTVDGLTVVDLARIRQLPVARQQHEEDHVASLVPLCCLVPHPAPSIDTTMHAFLPAAHVDHLHPDSAMALATAEEGERLTRECFGDTVAWLPWRRPGSILAGELAGLSRADSSLHGVVLGGHGITAWGDGSAECEKASLGMIARAERFIAEVGRPDPFGPVVPGREPLAADERRRVAAALAPYIRGLCSSDAPMVGHFTQSTQLLDFLARAGAPRLAALGAPCPDHFVRTKIRPLLVDLAPGRPIGDLVAGLSELVAAYREEYAAYYLRHADADTPPMRGADPRIVLLPGVGMWSFGRDAKEARIAGEFYLSAIAVMRGAESLSSYAPMSEAERFRIEYWELEEAKLRTRPAAGPLQGKVALVTGASSGIGRAVARRLGAEGAAVVAADRDVVGLDALVKELGGPDQATGVPIDVSSEGSVEEGVTAAVLCRAGIDIIVNSAGLSLSRSLVDTTVEDWDLQHDVMARGSFLVSRAGARVMLAQGMRADIVYIVSKNAVFGGPDNVAYGAAKADQAHQVRLLAAELGPSGIRVNGVNPDGVVSGSNIFANGWGRDRARAHGVPEEKLGEFYASRTLLKQEVRPEHVADAVFALVGGELSLTTGTLIPVDGGLPAAFLR